MSTLCQTIFTLRLSREPSKIVQAELSTWHHYKNLKSAESDFRSERAVQLSGFVANWRTHSAPGISPNLERPSSINGEPLGSGPILATSASLLRARLVPKSAAVPRTASWRLPAPRVAHVNSCWQVVRQVCQFLPNFGGLVLGCIEADYKQKCLITVSLCNERLKGRFESNRCPEIKINENLIQKIVLDFFPLKKL